METDYWHSLDWKTPLRPVNPKVIGTSGAYPKKGMEQLRAKVFEGASVVELGFTGKAKGNLGGGATTPEMHSKEEREEMREMAKINEVDLTTHTTVSIGGLAGFEQGQFRPESKEQAVHEIKRTIDFAADVAQGGPVTVHTGEFPRPVAEIEKRGEKPVFEAYPGEEKKAAEWLVDKKTGEVVTGLRKDIEIPIPKWKMKGEDYIDEKGNILKGEDVFTKRAPIINETTGKVEVEKGGWEHFEKEAKRWNNVYPKNSKTPAEMMYKEQTEAQRKQLKSQEVYYINFYDRSKKELKNLEGFHKEVKEDKHILETASPGSERWLAAKAKIKTREEEAMKRGIELPIEDKDFQNQKEKLQAEVEGFREGITHAAEGIKQLEIKEERIEPLEKFGVKESADALARSAIYAYDKEKTMKLKKTLFVAPENVFPEAYGAHPKELKNLILKSREEMSKKLHDERGMSKAEAKKIADEHIKATYDVGHAHTWKKLFVRKSGETSEEHEKRFKKWEEEEVAKLQKEGIIGHVHVSDNFGYYDEHLEPGGGNVPIKELAEKLQKHGYKGKFIAEWGAQPEAQSFRAMTGAWRTLSSPVYKIDTSGMAWTDVEGSYFGRTAAPSFIVGDYAPSKDWTLWSEVPFE